MPEEFECDLHPGQTVQVAATGETFMVSEVVGVVRGREGHEWAVADASGRWFSVNELERPGAEAAAHEAA
jgi:hypothetical protein